jgi:hypothetical protein
MSIVNKQEEHVTWKSLKSLPQFWDFVDEEGLCRGCIAFEVDDRILVATGEDDKRGIFHKYQQWYRDNL